MNIDNDNYNDNFSIASSLQSDLITTTKSRSRTDFHPSEQIEEGTSKGLTEVKSTVSVSSRLSKVNSLSRAITKNIASLYEQVKDDNLQTLLDDEERKQTKLGRELTNPGLEHAIRIATQKSIKTDQGHSSLVHQAEDQEDSDHDYETKYPPVDKGYCWLISLAGFMAMFATYGSSGGFGVYLSYWINHETFPGQTPLDFAWIGGILLGFGALFSSVVQLLSATLGLRSTFSIGMVIHFLGYFLTSFSTQLWQIYLTQGVLVGIGFAFIFNPPMNLIPEWFDKKRGTGSGLAVCGSGVGGVVFSLASQNLIDRTGSYKWSLRMVAIVCLAANLCVAALSKHRKPVPLTKSWKGVKSRIKILFDVKVLGLSRLFLIAFWNALMAGCYNVTLFSLAAYCTFVGLTQKQGSNATAIFGGCQVLGRITIGYGADKLGRVNMAIFSTTITAVLILAMWTNAQTYGVVVAYAVILSFNLPVASTLSVAILADATPAELFPSSWTYSQIICGAILIVSEVIALKLRTPGASNPFLHAQVYSGCLAIGALLFLIPVRQWVIKAKIQKWLEKTEDQLALLNSPSSKGLKVSESDADVLRKRRATYQSKLQPGVGGYLFRLCYPIKA